MLELDTYINDNSSNSVFKEYFSRHNSLFIKKDESFSNAIRVNLPDHFNILKIILLHTE